MPPRGRRPPARPRAVIYARQSETTEESISLALQEASAREYAARAGYDVVAVLTDPGISGRRWENRPGIVEAVRMIEGREADVLVVWKWSRFSRRRLDLAVGFDRVETAGGRVESSTEAVDTRTASGRFARGMLGEVAAFESERIGEGWKETHASRRSRGVPAQGGDRYGYRRERDEHGRVTGYVIDEGSGDGGENRLSPAEALRLAYGWAIAGWGAHRIARELNRHGYRNRIGALFKRTQIYPLLDSGFAAGLIVHRPRRPDGSPAGEVEYHEGAHPPIIDEKTWQAYLTARRRRLTEAPRTLASTHPLSGLLRCGDCGARMTAYSTPGPNRTSTAPTYACNRWRRVGSEYARCVTTTRRNAERVVRQWLEGVAADVEAAAAADRKTRTRQRKARTDAKRAAARITDLNRQLADLELSPIKSRAPDAFREAQDRLLDELDATQAAADTAARDAERDPAATRSTAGRLLELWPADGPMRVPAEDLRRGLGILIRSVWVFPPAVPGQASQVRVVPVWEDEPEI